MHGRRILVTLVAALAALPLGGCQALCGGIVGVFCPQSEDNPLNDPPVVRTDISFSPANSFDGCPGQAFVDRTTTFTLGPQPSPGNPEPSGLVSDPDGDPLLFEWDLDGDGEFEAGGTGRIPSGVSGEQVSTVYRAPGAVLVRVRVSDFPQYLGAPGAVERTRRITVLDPDQNSPPRAAIGASAPAVAGSAVVFDARSASDADPWDSGGLGYNWDFGDGSFSPLENVLAPGFESVAHTYAAPGDYTVKLKVGDCLGAVDVAELHLTVRAPTPSSSAPIARFTVSPATPVVGQEVTLDASGSSDPNGRIVRYEWDLDGNDTFERDGGGNPVLTTSFDSAESHVVGLRVTDDEGLVSVERASFVVDQGGAPTASFTVFPQSPLVNQDVSFNAGASRDPDGRIVRYEFDLDGNGSFEFDTAGEPSFTTRYSTPGERVVALRVTDEQGLTDIATQAVNVRSETAPSSAAKARRVAPALAFSARLRGRPLPAGRGHRREHGRRRSLVGVLGRGRLRVRLLDPPGRPSRAQRRLRRFLRAPWRARVSFRYDRATKRWRAGAVVLARARRGRPASACLRLRLGARPGRHATGRLRVLGGRGAGARLRGSATFRFRLERNGAATVLGRLRIRTGPKRALPSACRRLAAPGRG